MTWRLRLPKALKENTFPGNPREETTGDDSGEGKEEGGNPCDRGWQRGEGEGSWWLGGERGNVFEFAKRGSMTSYLEGKEGEGSIFVYERAKMGSGTEVGIS